MQEAHLTEVRRKYLNFQYRMEVSVKQPDDYLHINIDDCDQAKFDLPHLLQNMKITSGLLKINTHVTGCIVTNGKLQNDQNRHIFLNCDQFMQERGVQMF